MLGQIPKLTHISLDSWDFRKFSGVSKPDKIHFPTLTSLELTSCRLDDEKLEILLKIFPVENITKLDLSYNKLDTSFIGKYLSQFKSLTSLTLMGMGQLEWGFLSKINIASPHLKKLSMGTFVALKNDLKSVALERLDSLSIHYDLGNSGKDLQEEQYKRRCAIDNHWLKSIFPGFTLDPQTEEFYRGISTRTLTFKRPQN